MTDEEIESLYAIPSSASIHTAGERFLAVVGMKYLMSRDPHDWTRFVGRMWSFKDIFGKNVPLSLDPMFLAYVMSSAASQSTPFVYTYEERISSDRHFMIGRSIGQCLIDAKAGDISHWWVYKLHAFVDNYLQLLATSYAQDSFFLGILEAHRLDDIRNEIWPSELPLSQYADSVINVQ
ncbi:hypothetical protein HY408_00945 [Candidatus Gottesmanbacteria bacterium]|nr:hypothetical protein [Candidatus Gottesmanbacteria bacterium]